MNDTTFKEITREQATELFGKGVLIYFTNCSQLSPDEVRMRPSFFLSRNTIFYITTELHNKLMTPTSNRTPQQAFKDALPTAQAWAEGKKIQVTTGDNQNRWEDYEATCPAFWNTSILWRIKPAPIRVPFNQQTIPADAWFKRRDSVTYGRLQDISDLSVALFASRYAYEQLANDFLWSTDRVNWHPCYTTKDT